MFFDSEVKIKNIGDYINEIKRLRVLIVQVMNSFSGTVGMEIKYGNFYQRCKETFAVTMKSFSVKNDIIPMIFK